MGVRIGGHGCGRAILSCIPIAFLLVWSAYSFGPFLYFWPLSLFFRFLLSFLCAFFRIAGSLVTFLHRGTRTGGARAVRWHGVCDIGAHRSQGDNRMC